MDLLQAYKIGDMSAFIQRFVLVAPVNFDYLLIVCPFDKNHTESNPVASEVLVVCLCAHHVVHVVDNIDLGEVDRHPHEPHGDGGFRKSRRKQNYRVLFSVLVLVERNMSLVLGDVDVLDPKILSFRGNEDIISDTLELRRPFSNVEYQLIMSLVVLGQVVSNVPSKFAP